MKSAKHVMSSAISAVALASLFVGGSAGVAHADGEPESVEQLERQFEKAQAAGDSTAEDNLEKLHKLTDAEKIELDELMGGQREESPRLSWDEAQQTRQVSEPQSKSSTQASKKHNIWGTQAMTFAGIKLTETKVSATITTNGTKVTKVNSSSSKLVKNYQPLTNVTVADPSSKISGGKATVKAKVRVERGPAPGLGGNWSTKESYHTIVGSGKGKVVSNTWT